MFQMLFFGLAKDDYIIDVDQAANPEQRPKDLVQDPLEMRRRISKPKGQRPPSVESLLSNKGRLLLAILVHRYLPIPRKKVHGRKDLLSSKPGIQILDVG